MLLSLVTHASGYKIMVGVHNTVDVTVECRMHVGGCAALFRTVDVSTCKYCLMPRGTSGALPYGSFNGAYNTVEENVGAYNTVYVRAVAEYCSCRCTGYGPWYRGLTQVPWLAFSVRPCLLPSGRSWSDGPSRLWSRQSEKSGEQGSCEPRSEMRGQSRK